MQRAASARAAGLPLARIANDSKTDIWKLLARFSTLDARLANSAGVDTPSGTARLEVSAGRRCGIAHCASALSHAPIDLLLRIKPSAGVREVAAGALSLFHQIGDPVRILDTRRFFVGEFLRLCSDRHRYCKRQERDSANVLKFHLNDSLIANLYESRPCRRLSLLSAHHPRSQRPLP